MLWSGSNELPPALVPTREEAWDFLRSLLDNIDKGTDAHSWRSLLRYVTIYVMNEAFAKKSDLLLMWESHGSVPLLWMQWYRTMYCIDYNTFCHLNLIQKYIFLTILCGICWINPLNNEFLYLSNDHIYWGQWLNVVINFSCRIFMFSNSKKGKHEKWIVNKYSLWRCINKY